MAELFDASKQNLSLHINNIFMENELVENSVVKFSLTTAKAGKKYRSERGLNNVNKNQVYQFFQDFKRG